MVLPFSRFSGTLRLKTALSFTIRQCGSSSPFVTPLRFVLSLVLSMARRDRRAI